MRKIFITVQLERLVLNYSKNPFAKRTKGFETPLERLKNLREEILVGSANYQQYVQKIEKEYKSINSLKPSQIKDKKNEFELIIKEKDLKTKFPIKVTKKDGTEDNKDVEFYKLVVEAMRYEDLREYDFHVVLNELGIKSCVYCNSQLTIITKKNKANNKAYARLELDHYFPKSKYPFLCTNFFNLYPACGSCNRIKSYRDAKFTLYTEEQDDVDVFRFKLNKKSVVKYLFSRKNEDIQFELRAHPKAIEDIVKHHDGMFCIQEIYNTQKDIAEELILKKEAYTEAYKNDLVDNFKNLFPDKAIINRLLIGNYDRPEEIHKRPMSKFMQDIATDLHLIK